MTQRKDENAAAAKDALALVLIAAGVLILTVLLAGELRAQSSQVVGPWASGRPGDDGGNLPTCPSGQTPVSNGTSYVCPSAPGAFDAVEQVEPGNPPASTARFFLDQADVLWKFKTSDGTVTAVGSGGGGGWTWSSAFAGSQNNTLYYIADCYAMVGTAVATDGRDGAGFNNTTDSGCTIGPFPHPGEPYQMDFWYSTTSDNYGALRLVDFSINSVCYGEGDNTAPSASDGGADFGGAGMEIPPVQAGEPYQQGTLTVPMTTTRPDGSTPCARGDASYIAFFRDYDDATFDTYPGVLKGLGVGLSLQE